MQHWVSDMFPTSLIQGAYRKGMGYMALGDRISPAMLGCRVILLIMLIAAIQEAQSRPDFERLASYLKRFMRSIVSQCLGYDRRM